MGMFRQYFLPAVMLTLLLFFTSVWLPQGSVQDCELSWLPCLNVLPETIKVISVTAGPLSDNKAHIISNNNNNEVIIGACPGQDFQVSRLLQYLNSALGPASDVLLEPYLLCWEELIKFMEALGPLVSFFTGKVQEKIVLIRQLAEEEAAKPHLAHNPQHHAYSSVRLMLEAELRRGVVNFDRRTDSGCRTLLRLHRSLLWLQLLLEKVVSDGRGDGGRHGNDGGHYNVDHDDGGGGHGDGGGRHGDGGGGRHGDGGGRSLGELCAEAYSQALAPHHPWLLQQAAQLAFRVMPSRAELLHIVCVRSQEEAEPVMLSIITAIREVHQRTQRQLEQRDMLNLP